MTKSSRKCRLFEKCIDYIAETSKIGNGINLYEIRNIINERHDQNFISNKEIKLFLVERFGEEIQSYPFF